MRGVTLNLIGVLLAVMVAFKSAHALQCHTCVYGKLDKDDYGDTSCKEGWAGHVVECNEDSVIPISTHNPSGPRTTLGDLRRKLADPKMALGKTVYECALVEVTADVEGSRFYMFTRSCSFAAKPRSGFRCETVRIREYEKAPFFPMPVESALGDNAIVATCACNMDECRPERPSSWNPVVTTTTKRPKSKNAHTARGHRHFI